MGADQVAPTDGEMRFGPRHDEAISAHLTGGSAACPERPRTPEPVQKTLFVLSFHGVGRFCMAGIIEGVSRDQTTLFPERLDDWVAEDNLARVVDIFVDELDLAAIGFHRHAAARTGRQQREDRQPPCASGSRGGAVYRGSRTDRPSGGRRDQGRTCRSSDRPISWHPARDRTASGDGEGVGRCPDGQISRTDPDARAMATRA